MTDHYFINPEGAIVGMGKLDELFEGCVAIDVPPMQPCWTPRWDFESEQWVDDGEPLGNLKDRQLAAINEACEAVISELKKGYPQSEVDTWTKQESEARGWKADNSVSVPLLSGMAQKRGLEVSDLVERVIVNADAWTRTIAAVIGKRQALEDQIMAVDLEAVDAREQLLAVTWD